MAAMKSSTCSRRAREYVAADVRRRLAEHANFACSVCGAIPIVFHHIERWSKRFSNHEDLLIPVCDKCHRDIHGKGGSLFSKDELYDYRDNPKRPLLVSDKLPLERETSYSFFVGSNFVDNGIKASLFTFSEGHNLLTIDTSTGNLVLNILAGIQDDRKIYLIQNNELMIDTEDLWDTRYSPSSLKIWRTVDGRKTVFIDLAIKPDVIILKEMNTIFDGKPFRIYRFRRPQQRQVDKIVKRVKQYEESYHKLASRIDGRPKIGGVFNGMDVDILMKQTQKEHLKTQVEQQLTYGLYSEFNWDWRYYCWVLGQTLSESSVFARTQDVPANLPERFKRTYEAIAAIKAKYAKELKKLENTVVEFDGDIWLRNVQTLYFPEEYWRG